MELNKNLEKKLNILSYESRILSMKSFHRSYDKSHYGGCFSAAEILTVLYHTILKINPKNPKWKLRDHFVLSKGHIAGILSSVLALRGFFNKENVFTYHKLDSAFGTHTTKKITGCEFAAGSLGHGLGFGIGLALAKKLDKMKSRVFVYMGDGENDEGTVWEGAMVAAKYKLDNLIVIIDRNYLQASGNTEEVMPLEPLEEKWRSFGWVVKTINGHDIQNIYKILSSVPFENFKPSCIIAKTVKGMGLPFMEGKSNFHSYKLVDIEYNESLKILENCKNKFR